MKLLISLLLCITFFVNNLLAKSEAKEAIFAGGCFWCLEHDFEQVDNVTQVITGFTNNSANKSANNPTFEQVNKSKKGFRQAVKVIYKNKKYEELVIFFLRNIDPTNQLGQACEVGHSYTPAIFYKTPKEKEIATKQLALVSKTLKSPVKVALLPLKKFYQAADKHQNYYKKNEVAYNFYRQSCARDEVIKRVWGTAKK